MSTRLPFGGATEHPLVLVFEDLHWADDGLLDFVDHLVDWASGVRMLIVGTSRPKTGRPTRRPTARCADHGQAVGGL